MGIIDPVALLVKQCNEGETLRNYARRIGVSAPYLSDVFRGNRNPGPKILEFLGLKVDVKQTRTYTYSPAVKKVKR